MHDKMLLNGQIEYGEVQFYFLLFSTESPDASHAHPTAYALVSVYTRPIQELLDESSNTLWACQYTGNGDLRVVNDLYDCSLCFDAAATSIPERSSRALVCAGEVWLEDFQLTGFEEPIDNDPEEL